MLKSKGTEFSGWLPIVSVLEDANFQKPTGCNHAWKANYSFKTSRAKKLSREQIKKTRILEGHTCSKCNAIELKRG